MTQTSTNVGIRLSNPATNPSESAFSRGRSWGSLLVRHQQRGRAPRAGVAKLPSEALWKSAAGDRHGGVKLGGVGVCFDSTQIDVADAGLIKWTLRSDMIGALVNN